MLKSCWIFRTSIGQSGCISLQTNWIGRSEGASVIFHTEQGDPLEIFTTRPDTLWGATFMVLAPEHPLVERVTSMDQKAAVKAYIAQAERQSDIQREATDKEKTGIFTGGYAINPVNQERIPIWIADYVLMSYGTGAIMAVPAHDERDFQFALKFGLPIIPVIERPDGLTKSFVPQGFAGAGFEAALQANGFSFKAQPAGLAVNILGEEGRALYPIGAAASAARSLDRGGRYRLAVYLLRRRVEMGFGRKRPAHLGAHQTAGSEPACADCDGNALGAGMVPRRSVPR